MICPILYVNNAFGEFFSWYAHNAPVISDFKLSSTFRLTWHRNVAQIVCAHFIFIFIFIQTFSKFGGGLHLIQPFGSWYIDRSFTYCSCFTCFALKLEKVAFKVQKTVLESLPLSIFLLDFGRFVWSQYQTNFLVTFFAANIITNSLKHFN